MIERYTLPEMAAVWSDEARYQRWLEVELAACEANCQLGRIPPGAMEDIRARASFNVEQILHIEAQVRHDIIAFLTNLNEQVGDAGRYIHMGMTSSDVLDTALALQMKAAVALLQQELNQLEAAIRQQAQRHKHTVMVGRSHGIHGEPITLGFKLAGWLAEVQRHQGRLARLEQVVAVGQVSGAMGTYANIDPRVEALVCTQLGLTPDTVSTQVVSRDRHAEYVQTMALVGATLDRFATEVRNLQRTDVLEVEEHFAKGQKGSSAMPHKRNPVRSERISGLARLLRGYALAALENVPLWHERDISHSSAERVLLPDCSITLHFMLREMTDVVAGLVAYPETMLRNMTIYGGVIFSQQVMLALVDAGLSREEAYALVQHHAHKAWNQPGGDFQASLAADSRVKAHLNGEALAACFSPQQHQANLDQVWQRLGL